MFCLSFRAERGISSLILEKLRFLARLPMNSYQLSLGYGAVAPVGRIIPNPPGLILNRRVKDNAPYLEQFMGLFYASRATASFGFSE
jgi:hypothetical protein